MGGALSPCNDALGEFSDEGVSSASNFDRFRPSGTSEQSRVLLLAPSYPHLAGGPVGNFTSRVASAAEVDSLRVAYLCRRFGIDDVTTLTGVSCTARGVLRVVREVAKRCTADDFLIIGFTGLGASAAARVFQPEDADGFISEDSDGVSRGILVANEPGRPGESPVLRESSLREALHGSLPPESRLLFLSDCCFEGRLSDLEAETWQDWAVAEVSGSLDVPYSPVELAQHSGRGVLTQTLLAVVEEFANSGIEHYSVGAFHNMATKMAKKLLGKKAGWSITTETPLGFSPAQLVWPLAPSLYPAVDE